MKFTILRALVAAALLWGGGQGLYTWLRNREPTAMTCAEFASAPPKAEWLRLSDCELDLPNAGYAGIKDVTELYIPLRAPDAPETEPSRVVVQTQDPELVGLVNQLAKATSIAALTPAQREKLTGKHTFEGLVLFGIELKDSKRKSVADVTTNVATDFVLLKDGEKPRVLFHAAFFTAGLILLGFLLRGWRQRSAESGAAAPKPAPPAS